ncbi:MAG: ATPase inhibitor subunit zeta [Alphaproteobacteria bacterium]
MAFGWLNNWSLEANEAEIYASDIVAANLEEPGFEDVKRAVTSDINAKGLGISPETLDEKLAEFFAIAQKQIKENG